MSSSTAGKDEGGAADRLRMRMSRAWGSGGKRTPLAMLRDIWRWTILRSPEVLLVFFAMCLLPLLYLLGGAVAGLWRSYGDAPGDFVALLKGDPWLGVAWAICVLGTLLVGTVCWRSRTPIWAVARKLIIEAFHRKVFVVLVLFFVVLMPSLPFILKTEGNLKSHVQIVITYSLTLAQVLLSVLAVFLCTASICSEVEKKHVQVTDTKPMMRWQFLVGKLAGAVVLCASLLFLMAGSVYGLVRYMARERSFPAAAAGQRQRRERDLRFVREKVLVARRAIRPAPPDVEEDLKKQHEMIAEMGGGLLPTAEAWASRTMRTTLQRHKLTVPPRAGHRWELRGLRHNEEEPVYLRFSMRLTESSARKEAQGEWFFYRLPSPEQGGDGGERHARVFRWRGPFSTTGSQEITLPGWVVDEAGTLRMEYWNYEKDASVQFEPQVGIEVLQRVEGFLPNYYRAMLVILCHIVVLAALALMAGSALSFPVATFAVVACLIVGLISPFVSDINLSYGASTGQHSGFEGLEVARAWLQEVAAYCARGAAYLFPQFARFSPLSDLVNGRFVTWGMVGKAAASMCFVKGLAAMLIGIYLYSRRELARVVA